MDFVDGPSLSGRIGSGPLSPVEVRALFSRIAEGLAVAHAAGVVHRDLTPDNIILRDGDPARPVLIDFGIARSSSDGTLIGSGFAGKVNYVSPEQLGMFGGEVTARSDIYSLGLVIAASLTGKPIDMGGTHLELLEKRRHVPDLTDLPDEFRPLLEDMLAPAPSERQRSGADVARWLAQGTDAQRPWDLAHSDRRQARTALARQQRRSTGEARLVGPPGAFAMGPCTGPDGCRSDCNRLRHLCRKTNRRPGARCVRW